MDTVKQFQDRKRGLLEKGRNIIDRALREGRAMHPAEEVDVEGIGLKVQAMSRTLRMAHSLSLIHI